MTLFGYWGSRLRGPQSFRVFRCLSYRILYVAWLDLGGVQGPMVWLTVGTGAQPRGGHRVGRREFVREASRIFTLHPLCVEAPVLGDGCWIMLWSGISATIIGAARSTLPGRRVSVSSEVCTPSERIKIPGLCLEILSLAGQLCSGGETPT